MPSGPCSLWHVLDVLGFWVYGLQVIKLILSRMCITHSFLGSPCHVVSNYLCRWLQPTGRVYINTIVAVNQNAVKFEVIWALLIVGSACLLLMLNT